MVICSLDFQSHEAVTYLRTYRTLSYFNMNTFQEDFYSIQFYFIFDMLCVNDKIDFLTDSSAFLHDSHFPLVTAPVPKLPTPWLTDPIKCMQKLRANALKSFRKSKSVSQWNYYKSLRNLTIESIYRKKRVYVEYQLQNNPYNIKNI